MEYDAFSSTSTQDLASCNYCGRSFNPNSLARHENICQKTTQKKRKVFDSAKHRVEGTEIKLPKNRPKPGHPPKPEPPKKSNWRQKHDDFINAIRSAKGVQEAIDSGRPLPPPPPPSINPDYVQCPHCDRRFNPGAAERHIGFCKEQHERLPNKKVPTNDALKRNAARTQFKVPRPKAKDDPMSPTSPEAYGHPRGLGQAVPKQPPARNTSASSYTVTSPKSANVSHPAGSRSHQTVNNRYSSGGGGGGGSGGGHGGGPAGVGGYGGYDDRNGSDSPGSGRALRTGRTADTYNEARQLSAKQRGSTMPNKSSRYGGLGRASPNPRGSGSSGYQSSESPPALGRIGSGVAKFCHDCGTKYPVPHAKFCCECGKKRIMVG